MARFYFSSKEAISQAYETLQKMARELDPVSSASQPPPTDSFEVLSIDPESIPKDQLKLWASEINCLTNLTGKPGWNNFTGNVARFGNVYQILRYYDAVDEGGLDGTIDLPHQEYSFATEDPPVPGQEAEISQDCQASKYGVPGRDSFTGKTTASGVKHTPTALTAAHRDLPLGTVIVVQRKGPDNQPVGPVVTVMVTDRGPFFDPDRDKDYREHGRDLDLSPAVFAALGIAQQDLTQVVYWVKKPDGTKTL